MSCQYKNIIWDYNGTIIDDAQLAVDAENMVLASYGKGPITLEYYLAECEMPILNFYYKLFDMHKYDFSEIAKRFMQYYGQLSGGLSVFPEVREVISYLDGKGYNQAVISGFETGRLTNSLTQFGLDGYFKFMSGSDNIDCSSKSERALKVITENGFDPKETLFIGDMYHDYETAKFSGADCLLIAKGHQGADVLKAYGSVKVLDNALELKELL